MYCSCMKTIPTFTSNIPIASYGSCKSRDCFDTTAVHYIAQLDFKLSLLKVMGIQYAHAFILSNEYH